MTGGRIKRIQKYIGDEPFLLTYGDGLTNANIPEVVKFHQDHGKFATLTAVQPTARFGSLIFGNGTEITKFQEKPKGEGGWINGGFFVLQPQVLIILTVTRPISKGALGAVSCLWRTACV